MQIYFGVLLLLPYVQAINQEFSLFFACNKPFAGSGHMVRNKLFWDANNAVGLPKQMNSYQSSPTFLCFESPAALFASQHILFPTMWTGSCKEPNTLLSLQARGRTTKTSWSSIRNSFFGFVTFIIISRISTGLSGRFPANWFSASNRLVFKT